MGIDHYEHSPRRNLHFHKTRPNPRHNLRPKDLKRRSLMSDEKKPEEKNLEKNLHYIGLSGETVSKEIYDVVCGQRDRAEADLTVARHLLSKLTASLHAITGG